MKTIKAPFQPPGWTRCSGQHPILSGSPEDLQGAKGTNSSTNSVRFRAGVVLVHKAIHHLVPRYYEGHRGPPKGSWGKSHPVKLELLSVCKGSQAGAGTASTPCCAPCTGTPQAWSWQEMVDGLQDSQGAGQRQATEA